MVALTALFGVVVMDFGEANFAAIP